MKDGPKVPGGPKKQAIDQKGGWRTAALLFRSWGRMLGGKGEKIGVPFHGQELKSIKGGLTEPKKNGRNELHSV